MEHSEFLVYFEKSKEELKSILNQVQQTLAEISEILELDPDDVETKLLQQNEEERYKAIMLALIAADDNACLTTVDFKDYGTLNINNMYGYKTRYSVDVDMKKTAPREEE